MGGFTRPRELRSSNWWPGGPYVGKGKEYESPLPEAYAPHTVYLLETRYPVNHGTGRPIAVEHVTGMCKGNALPSVLKHLNSVPTSGTGNTVSKYTNWMDNAVWPWSSRMRGRREIWWTSDDRPNFWKDFHSGKISIDEVEKRWHSSSSEECGTTLIPKTQGSASESITRFVMPPSISLDALRSNDSSQSLDNSGYQTSTKSNSQMKTYRDYSTVTSIHSSGMQPSLLNRNVGSEKRRQASSTAQPANEQNSLDCGLTPPGPPELFSPRASPLVECRPDEPTRPSSASHGTKVPFRQEVEELSAVRANYESTLSVAPFYLP